MEMTEAQNVDTANDWGLILLQGIAAVILGLFLVTAPALALTVAVTFIGAYWLASGILSIVRIFTGANSAHWAWALFAGLIGVLAGLIVLRHPFVSAVLLPAVVISVLGFMGLIMGVVNFVRGLIGEGAGVVLIGVVDFILGLVLLGSPIIAAESLPLIAGILALFGGVSLVVVAFSARPAKTGGQVVEHRRRAA